MFPNEFHMPGEITLQAHVMHAVTSGSEKTYHF